MSTTTKLINRVERARKRYNEFKQLSEEALLIFRVPLPVSKIGEIVNSGCWEIIYFKYNNILEESGNYDVFVAFRQLEQGEITKLEFFSQLKNTEAAVETKLEELKNKYKEAEDALYIHSYEYFKKFANYPKGSVKGLVARIAMDEPEAMNLFMGLLKS